MSEIYTKYDGTYGYRQLQLFLWQEKGVWMNHKKVLRLMQALGIQSRIRKKRRYTYTDHATGLVAENVLKQHFKAEQPNEKWATDITQYPVGERWLYLSAVKDLFNNEIVVYEIGEKPDKELVQYTFKRAFRKRKDVVVHSDRRAPYTSHLYHDMLPKVGARISMSRGGNDYDNASIESFFSHLKRKGSTCILFEVGLKHKNESSDIFIFTTTNVHKKAKQTDTGRIPTPVHFLGCFEVSIK